MKSLTGTEFWTGKCSCYLTVAVLLVQAGRQPGGLAVSYTYSQVSVFKLQSPYCQVLDTDTVKYGYVYHSH